MQRHALREIEPRFDPDNGVDTVNDPRGVIEFIAEGPFDCVLRIFSKAGSVRSNHYHKHGAHVIYVVCGRMEYYERPARSNQKPDFNKIDSGQWIFTEPMMEHTTVFPVHTEILVFSTAPRDQTSYENDLVHTQDLSAL